MNCWSSYIFICIILNGIRFLIHSFYGWRKWLNRKSVAEKNKKRQREPLSENYQRLTPGGSQHHRDRTRSTTVHYFPFTCPVPPSSPVTHGCILFWWPIMVLYMLNFCWYLDRMKNWSETDILGSVLLHILPKAEESSPFSFTTLFIM